MHKFNPESNRFIGGFNEMLAPTITFNEILMIPQYSDIESRSHCDVSTRISKNIGLKIPIVTSPMDTVTETQMAIGMARLGGLGVIHRFNTIANQVKMIRKVKRSENIIIRDPYVVDENDSIQNLLNFQKETNVKTFLVTKNMKNKNIHKMSICSNDIIDDTPSNKELVGIVTNRDIKASKSSTTTVKQLMTKLEKMKTYKIEENQILKDIDKQHLYEMILENRIEKLPIVNNKNQIIGLATEKDLHRYLHFNNSNTDQNGNLIVAAAVGCKGDYLERSHALVESGCDLLCVDVANGHNQMTIDALLELKENFPKIDVIAGNVATGYGARKLIEAGADSIRCGIGNGSICITRIVSGCGVPQFSALCSVAPVCKEFGIPLMSDGGNKNSGNMCKALAIGADCVMLGRLVAGTDESPGQPFIHNGNLVKITRGMAGYGANLSKAQKTLEKQPDSLKFSAEGVEGFVSYSGKLENLIHRFVMGIKSGMSYMGARNIKELREKVQFTVISPSSIVESNVHGIKRF